MSLYKKLLNQTAIYGLATVLPRMMSFLLVRLYVDYMPSEEYGEVSVIFAYLIFLNVILSYGMETSFFRFYNREINKDKVISTSTISLLVTTTLFLCLGIFFKESIAFVSKIKADYIIYTLLILVLDALVIIPFSKLRAESRSLKFALIKIANVALNLGLNVFLIVYLPQWHTKSSVLDSIYIADFQIGYIFISNLLASLITLLILLPDYFKLKWNFDRLLWKQMMQYGFPILIAGIAFAINEHFDKILLEWMGVSLSNIGAYSACYKIGMFMVLFRTAYTLGIEPFFFSHASNENAPKTYATITKYFVIFGSFMSLSVIVFADVLKLILVPKDSYWIAMDIVPLIVMANFFLGIYTNLSVWYKLIDKTKIGAYISIVGAIVTLLLNIILIPFIGFVGSAIATIIAYASMMLISYYLGQKKYPIPYDMKKIFSYLGISIVLSGLSFYIPVFRKTYIFGIVAILFFCYYIYRNEKEVLLRIVRRK